MQFVVKSFSLREDGDLQRSAAKLTLLNDITVLVEFDAAGRFVGPPVQDLTLARAICAQAGKLVGKSSGEDFLALEKRILRQKR